ncbi:hypothetical protein FRC06_011673 [Ceratobasidium sp. 370]|nr:hypothetical protein FRC06_011673 [Ceratobasidium sp. 370]
MSKCKIVAGGYEESSDGPDIDLIASPKPSSKRSKSAPYAPPRLTIPSKPGPTPFQLPSSAVSSTRGSVPPRHVSTSSRRPTPAPDNTQTARNTPEIQMCPETRDGTPIESLFKPIQGPHPSAPHKLNSARPTLALERQINELLEAFGDHKSASDEQQRTVDERLGSMDNRITRILEAVTQLTAAGNTASQPPLSLSAPSTPSETTKSYLSNPTPTPDLIEIVSKVVAEARSRIGKKKGGNDENSCKEHARNTFYRMLGITAAREIRPFFEDEFDEPDTLPAQSTITNDRSELSNVLRNLSDEQIIVLLNDGPFKSAQAAWRDLRKTDVEIEVMRSNARRYQRCDRKAAVRAAHIKLIPSLQGSEWEYLSQTGYMSQDESDDEGGLVTQRPEYRSLWLHNCLNDWETAKESNLFDAIHLADCEKAKAKPGLCPRLPPRRIEIVRCPIPHLERGTGAAKSTIRIAVCGISKSWRRANPDEFKRYAHLLNTKANVRPDISSFLTQYPMLDTNGQSGQDDGGHLAESVGASGDGGGAEQGIGGYEADNATATGVAPKRRGRPPGSKNKKK